MKTQTGFTLIELLVTIALAAILLTLAVPSFQSTIRTNQLAAFTNEFVGSLQLARSEAVRRGVRVTVCKSADGANCIANLDGFEQGWIVFADPDNDATVDGGETIIQVYEGLAGGITLVGNTNPIDNYMSYTSDGFSRRTDNVMLTGNYSVCKAAESSDGRQIAISATGRVSTASITSC